LRADIDTDDVGTFARHMHGMRSALAPRRTGDECNLSGKAISHNSSSDSVIPEVGASHPSRALAIHG
jgi:hypothetical protein